MCLSAVIDSLRRRFFSNTDDETTPMLPWKHAAQTPNVVIDGSKYEGGGGIVRDALSFSAILGKPVIIENIRANRPGQTGLLLDHTHAVRAVGELCNAHVKGNYVGSRRLEFYPHEGPRKRKKIEKLEVQAERSVAITLIALLPVILFSSVGPCKGKTVISEKGVLLIIHGASIAADSPSWTTLRDVIFPTLRRAGLGLNIELLIGYMEGDTQGWCTDDWKTMALLTVYVTPLKNKLPAFILPRRGFLRTITIVGYAPRQHRNNLQLLVEAELRAAPAWELPKVRSTRVRVGTFIEVSNFLNHFHLLLVGRCPDPDASKDDKDAMCHIGYEQVFPQAKVFRPDLVDDPTKLMTTLARVCVRGLMEELQTVDSVDSHLQDMLIIYQALADGFSSVSSHGPLSAEDMANAQDGISYAKDYAINTFRQHQQASEWVAEQMAGIKFERVNDMYGCHGLGLG